MKFPKSNFHKEWEIFLKEKDNFLVDWWTFFNEAPKYSKETYVLNIFTTITISYSFLYMLATNHWKRFQEELLLCSWKTLQLEFIWKSYSHTKFWTHWFLGNMVTLQANLNPCFLEHIVGPKKFFISLGEGTLSCLEGQPCPLGKKGPDLP